METMTAGPASATPAVACSIGLHKRAPHTGVRIIIPAVTNHCGGMDQATPPSLKVTSGATASIRPAPPLAGPAIGVPLIRRQRTPRSHTDRMASPGTATAILTATLLPGTLIIQTPGDGIISVSHTNSHVSNHASNHANSPLGTATYLRE